jgi:hypothetical protein
MINTYNISKWPTKHAQLKIWVIEMAEMCQPIELYGATDQKRKKNCSSKRQSAQ